jgi:uncharacterized RDD family membrane protein YckC
MPMAPPPPPMGYGQAPVLPPGTKLSATGFPLAGWWARVGATVIDGVLLGIVNAIINAALRHNRTLRVHWTMTNTQNSTVTHYSFSFLALLIAGLVFLAYVTLMLAASGRTVGMMALGNKAVRANDDGAIGFGQALGRTIVQILLSYTVIVGLLSDLFPLWDARRQTLHDKAAGTVVIRSRTQ